MVESQTAFEVYLGGIMGDILVGTCSWTDPTLIRSGRFYPSWAKSAEDRLKFYASQFEIVEVDSSCHAMPTEVTSRLWVERTPQDFVFDVKAFRLFTEHPTQAKALPKDIRDALPTETKQKDNLYQRDVPSELTHELWSRFEQALLPSSLAECLKCPPLGIDAVAFSLFLGANSSV